MALSEVTRRFLLFSLGLWCNVHCRIYVPIRARGQDGFAQTAREGGSDPTNFWAAESRTKWGRSRPILTSWPHADFELHSSHLFIFPVLASALR